MIGRSMSLDLRDLAAAERLLGEALALTAASRLAGSGLWAATLLPTAPRRALYADAAAAVGQARSALSHIERQLGVLATDEA